MSTKPYKNQRIRANDLTKSPWFVAPNDVEDGTRNPTKRQGNRKLLNEPMRLNASWPRQRSEPIRRAPRQALPQLQRVLLELRGNPLERMRTLLDFRRALFELRRDLVQRKRPLLEFKPAPLDDTRTFIIYIRMASE